MDAWLSPSWLTYIVYGASGAALLLCAVITVLCVRWRRLKKTGAAVQPQARGGALPTMYAFGSQHGAFMESGFGDEADYIPEVKRIAAGGGRSRRSDDDEVEMGSLGEKRGGSSQAPNPSTRVVAFAFESSSSHHGSSTSLDGVGSNAPESSSATTSTTAAASKKSSSHQQHHLQLPQAAAQQPKGILRREGQPPRRVRGGQAAATAHSAKNNNDDDNDDNGNVPTMKRRLSFRRTDGSAEVRVEEYTLSPETEEVRVSLARKLSQRSSRQELMDRRILLRFADNVEIAPVDAYDRKPEATWAALSNDQKAEIRKELNEFKMYEMDVHEQSRQYTRFHEDANFDRAIAAHVGRRVFVKDFGGGVLRYYGPHHSQAGMRCGVELDEPLGLNNGTVAGHTYFLCAAKHGILCDPRAVVLPIPQSGASSQLPSPATPPPSSPSHVSPESGAGAGQQPRRPSVVLQQPGDESEEGGLLVSRL